MKGLLPRGLKRSLRTFVIDQLGIVESKVNRAASIDMPVVELEQKHINNLKVLLDRAALLRAMPKGAVCAEIGVNKGEFSSQIIVETNPSKLHLIDAWGDPKRYDDELKELVRAKFMHEIATGKVELNIGFSTDVLKNFQDSYFDWVYLDTDHTYKTTAAELQLLKDKVKRGGVIAGHDYTMGNWKGHFKYGVIEAVHELCVRENWELIFITTETDQTRNFAIRKLV